jgi:hypothetical protein
MICFSAMTYIHAGCVNDMTVATEALRHVQAPGFFHTPPSTSPRPTPTTGSTLSAPPRERASRGWYTTRCCVPWRLIRDTDRFATFRHVDEVIPGVRAILRNRQSVSSCRPHPNSPLVSCCEKTGTANDFGIH